MKKRYSQFNAKRKVKEDADLQHCSELAEQVQYGGNPEHKKNPGDFGLIPPGGPRPGKSLCDAVGIFSGKIALKHLRMGLSKGLISEQFKGRWPQNIWAVTEDGIPLESQLENQETGTYHGYPMPQSDPMSGDIIDKWNMRND